MIVSIYVPDEQPDNHGDEFEAVLELAFASGARYFYVNKRLYMFTRGTGTARPGASDREYMAVASHDVMGDYLTTILERQI